MKVTIMDDGPSNEEIDIIKKESKNIPEVSKKALREKMVGINEIKLSQQVVEFARDKLGMTPDEFVASVLKDLGLSH